MRKTIMSGIGGLALVAMGACSTNGYALDQTLEAPNSVNRMDYAKHALAHHEGASMNLVGRETGLAWEADGLSYSMTHGDYNNDNARDIVLNQGMVDPKCQVFTKGCTYLHGNDTHGMRLTAQIVDWNADGTVDEVVGMEFEAADALYQNAIDSLALMNYEGRTTP